jgi:hypothetical protein
MKLMLPGRIPIDHRAASGLSAGRNRGNGMHLRVDRVESDNESTLGRLYIDGRFQCWTLEDQYRAGPKVKGETRIPAGTYQLRLREEGGFHAQYLEKYGAPWHKGMLHVTNVPGFDFILLHIGNSHDDTQGCLLLGQGHSKVEGFHYVTASRPAYEAMYPKVRDALLGGATVEIEYVDLDPAAQRVAPVITDAVLVPARDPEPAALPATTSAEAAKTTPPPASQPESGKSGAVAGTAATAGAAVVVVGAAEVLGGDGASTPTNAGGAEAAPSGGLIEKITDPNNLLKVVLIGLGVVVVICAIYFIVRRLNEAKARREA